MKKRSAEILQKLLENPNEELSLQKLITGFHKTEKTLRNDIQEIMDLIKNQKMDGVLFFDGQVLKFNQLSLINELRRILYGMNFYHYKMSIEERKIYIIITLILEPDFYSMQQLAQEMYVTRNTIIDDCKIVDVYLKQHQLSFVAKSRKGIKIIGNEENITRLLIHIFNDLIPTPLHEKTFFTQVIIKKIGFRYALTTIRFHMEAYMRENNIIFATESFDYIAISIFVLINRIDFVEQITDSAKPVPLDTIGCIVQYVFTQLGYHTIELDKIIAIERIIFQGQLTPQVQSVNDFELYRTIYQFLMAISQEIHIELQSDDLLIKSLMAHIKSMHNWNDVDFEIDDEYRAFEFFRLRQIAEKQFGLLENYLQYTMNRKMKNSIIIHICAALMRNRQNMDPCNVIISCPGGMATSKYLEAQIKNHFNFNVVNTMTIKQIEMAKGQFDNIDFIIATVNIQHCVLPVVVVSPLITLEDINNIQRLTFNKRQSHPQNHDGSPFMAKIYAAYQACDDSQKGYLNQALSKVLDNLVIDAMATNQSMLLKMLALKYIKVVNEPIDWKNAMIKASEDLINDGFFDEDYLSEAINNVEEYGSYIIISPGIALAHGSKTTGVYHDGISLLVANNGIYFDNDECIHLLFFFAQKSDLDYLDLFKDLIKLGSDQRHINTIKNLSNVSDIYQFMAQCLTA